jgi:hypothetical protein
MTFKAALELGTRVERLAWLIAAWPPPAIMQCGSVTITPGTTSLILPTGAAKNAEATPSLPKGGGFSRVQGRSSRQHSPLYGG